MPLPPLKEEEFTGGSSETNSNDRVPNERANAACAFSLLPPKPLEPLTVVDTPVDFGDIDVSSTSCYSDDEEMSPRPKSLKDLVPSLGDKKASSEMTWAPKSSLDQGKLPGGTYAPAEAAWKELGSLNSNGSAKRSSGTSFNSGKERRLSGIPEQNSVKWRLHFRMIGQNAWSLTEALVTRAYQMFPLGDEPGRQAGTSKRNSAGATFTGSNGSSFAGRGSIGAGSSNLSPFSCHLQLDKLNDFEETGLASARVTSGRDGVSSQRSISSDTVGSEAGDQKISGSLKASLLPVEMFAEDVPQYETVESFKQSCTIFLVDPREENIDEGLSDLMRREKEVEGRIHACIRQNHVNGVPPLLSVVLMHGHTPIAAPAGMAADDMPLKRPSGPECGDNGVPPLSLENISDGQVAPFSGPVEGKYNKFVECVRRLSAQAKDDELFYRCNFDDSEALVQSMMKIACKIIVRRRSEDLIPITLEKLRQGMNTRRDKTCCSLL